MTTGIKQSKSSFFVFLIAFNATWTLFGCAEDETPPPSKEEMADIAINSSADVAIGCEAWGWNEDDECDWFCPNDPLCDFPPLGPEPEGQPARYPIVLAHGFNAGPDTIWSYNGIEELFTEEGHMVHEAVVFPFQSVEVRALELSGHVDFALEHFDAEKVHIIGHSMGSMDGRYLITNMDYGDRVASLTSIAGVHQGAPVADLVLDLTSGFNQDFLDSVVRLWGLTYNELAYDTDVQAAFSSLSTDYADTFNADNPDDPRVFYQSWAGISSHFGNAYDEADYEDCQGLILAHPEAGRDVLQALLWSLDPFTSGWNSEVASDGVVTVESAAGTNFRGCLPADHLDLVGQVAHDDYNQNTGWDFRRFYLNIAYELAEIENCSSPPVCVQGGPMGTTCTCGN